MKKKDVWIVGLIPYAQMWFAIGATVRIVIKTGHAISPASRGRMKKEFRFTIEPYRRRVTLIITDDVKGESNKIEPGYKSGWIAVVHCGDDGNPKIILPKKKDIGIITHEAVHAVNYIFQFCGVHSDRDNDEHFAYHLQSLVYKIINAYKKIEKEKK